MLFPDSIAASSALIDFGRPTNSGMTMCGKTTTSRKGSSGSVVTSGGVALGSAAIGAFSQGYGREHGVTPGGRKQGPGPEASQGTKPGLFGRSTAKPAWRHGQSTALPSAPTIVPDRKRH